MSGDAPAIVVGDTHGQRELVERLLDELVRDGLLDGRRLVFLGDYLDRGPDPRGLVELCIALRAEGHVMLCGNHEHALLRAVADHAAGADPAPWIDRWSRNFESGTLHGYGADTPRSRRSTPRIAALREAMPDAHLEFLAALEWFHEDERVLAIHAGPDPALDWPMQRPDLEARSTTNPRGPSQLFSHAWADDPTARVAGRTLVTGHATRGEPFVAAGRAMIDVGADRGRGLCAWISDLGITVLVGG